MSLPLNWPSVELVESIDFIESIEFFECLSAVRVLGVLAKAAPVAEEVESHAPETAVRKS